MLVTLSTSGLIGRTPEGQDFGGKPGRHDVLAAALQTTNHATIWAITDRGLAHRVVVMELPEVAGRSRGAATSEMFDLARGEKVIALSHGADEVLLFVSRNGIVKRIATADIDAGRSGVSVINLKDRDRLVAAFPAVDDTEFVMVATDTQALRTSADFVSLQGRAAAGVQGIKLRAGGYVAAAGPVEYGTVAVVVTDEGTEKVTDVAEVTAKGRATGGVRLAKLKGFETVVTYAWVGRGDDAVAIVASPEDKSQVRPHACPR